MSVTAPAAPHSGTGVIAALIVTMEINQEPDQNPEALASAQAGAQVSWPQQAAVRNILPDFPEAAASLVPLTALDLAFSRTSSNGVSAARFSMPVLSLADCALERVEFVLRGFVQKGKSTRIVCFAGLGSACQSFDFPLGQKVNASFDRQLDLKLAANRLAVEHDSFASGTAYFLIERHSQDDATTILVEAVEIAAYYVLRRQEPV